MASSLVLLVFVCLFLGIKKKTPEMICKFLEPFFGELYFHTTGLSFFITHKNWAIYNDQTAEVTPNGGLVRESPQNGLKLG